MRRLTLTTLGSMIPWALGCAGALLLAAPAFGQAETSADTDQWQSLFNGRNLLGWEKKSGQAHYWVEDGAIVGRTVEGSPNTFLCTEQSFSDFVLRFEVKLDDNPLNSGVQVRSKWDPDVKEGHVRGPQVEIEASPPGEALADPAGDAGYIYGEATGRGWLVEDRPIRRAFKNGEWNEFKVKANGPRYQVWINGKKITDLTDEKSPRTGIIGLQVHSIPEERGPYTVRWRNIKIRELN